MTATLLASIVGFVSAALMSLISHVLLLRKEKKIRLQALKSKLNDEQLTAYKKLWSCLEPTSRFSSEDTLIKYKKDGPYLDRNMVIAFTKSTRGMFFSESGLFLSRRVRKELFGLLDLLHNILGQNDSESLVKMEKQDLSQIRNSIKELIESIRIDVSLVDVEFPDYNEGNNV